MLLFCYNIVKGKYLEKYMALLRNRLVSTPEVSGGEDPYQLFSVRYQDGNTELVPLMELTLEETEHKEFSRINGERLGNLVNKISKKEYQDILDSQNPEKIKAKEIANEIPSHSDS